MLGSFSDFAARMEAQDRLQAAAEGRIVFRYHDPMRDDEMTFASFADQGYRAAYVYLRGGSDVYYLEAASDGEPNAEEIAQRIAPATLYLAASALPRSEGADPAASKRYDEYCRNYDAALADVQARRYGRQLELTLDALDRISLDQTGRASGDADIIRKIIDLKNGSADLLAAIVQNEAESLEPADGDARGADDLRGNIEALLWSMRGELGIGDAAADGYKRDIVAKGSAINRSLVASLTPAERNELFANFFLSRLDAEKPHSLYVSENGEAEAWLYYGKAAVEWKNKTGQRRIADKQGLKNGGGAAAAGSKAEATETAGGKFIFVFSEPEDRTGFFTQYHAIILDSQSVTYCRNFARWLPFTGGETASNFADLEFIDGSVTIGNKSLDGKPDIARTLKPFKEAYASDGYTRDRVAELAAGNLEKKAISILERPRFN